MIAISDIKDAFDAIDTRITQMEALIGARIDRALIDMYRDRDAALAERDNRLLLKDEELRHKDKQLSENAINLADLREKYDELHAHASELEQRSNHSFAKGRWFEGMATDRVKAMLQEIDGLAVEKVHAHAADMVVTIPLPRIDGGRKAVKVLIECKNENSLTHESKYIKTLARDCATQQADGAILLVAEIEPCLKDYANDTKTAHEKVGLAKEYMMLCDPTHLMPALVRLVARLQPLDASTSKDVFEAPRRLAMQRKCQTMAEFLIEESNLHSILPVCTHYQSVVSEAKAKLTKMANEFANDADNMFEDETKELVQASQRVLSKRSYCHGSDGWKRLKC